MFCESHREDVEYLPCTQENIDRNDFVEAWFRWPKLMSTTTAWSICVKNGKEVNAMLCNDTSNFDPIEQSTVQSSNDASGGVEVYELDMQENSSMTWKSIIISWSTSNDISIQSWTLETSKIDNSSCTLNWQPIDCAEVAKTAGSWLKTGLWTLLIIGTLFLAGGIFWLIMLIHAISNPIPNKVLWVAVIFFLSLLGAVIYYFVIKRKYTSVMVPNPNNPPYQMNVGVTYTEWPVNMPPPTTQPDPTPQTPPSPQTSSQNL